MIWDDVKALLKIGRDLTAHLNSIDSKLSTHDTKLDVVYENQRMHLAMLQNFIDERYRELHAQLRSLEAALIPTEAAYVVFLNVSDGITTEVTSMQMSIEKVCQLKIAPVDKFGNPAKVDGVPAWSLTNPALGALEVDADGMGAKFTPAGALGALAVQVNADADLGEGVKSIVGELPLELLAGEAVAVNVSGEVL